MAAYRCQATLVRYRKADNHTGIPRSRHRASTLSTRSGQPRCRSDRRRAVIEGSDKSTRTTRGHST